MVKGFIAFVIGGFLFPQSIVAQADEDNLGFDDFMKQYSSTIFPSERDALLDQFWMKAANNTIPAIDKKNHDVLFLYRGTDSVRVVGDFTSWQFSMPLRRMPDSDVWYLKLVFEPDARLDYTYIVNGVETIDPLNPRRVAGPKGVRSELAMPDFTSPPELEIQPGMEQGTISTLTISSKALGYDHQVIVYLPARYETSSSARPVVYFQDGREYMEFAGATTQLDNLIGSGAVQSLIAVFVVPPESAKRNRITGYALNKLYEKFITTELVPFIDKKYRTVATSEARLLIGSGHGATASLAIALDNSNILANAASQSGIIQFSRDTLLTMFGSTAARPRIYLGIGSYEKNVDGADLLTAHRRLAKVLEQRQFPFRYREFRDGHSWGRWRAELPNILRWFFPRKADVH
jgi:enterochelin esterase-like enzyme